MDKVKFVSKIHFNIISTKICNVLQHTFVQTSQFIVTYTFWPIAGAIFGTNSKAFVKLFTIAEIQLGTIAIWVWWLSNACWWTHWIGACICYLIICWTIFTFTIRCQINYIANRWTFWKRIHKWNHQTPNIGHTHIYLLENEILLFLKTLLIYLIANLPFLAGELTSRISINELTIIERLSFAEITVRIYA